MSKAPYGTVKNAAGSQPKGKRPKADPAVVITKPAYAGLGKAVIPFVFNDPAQWDEAYFKMLITYEPKGLGLPTDIKKFEPHWMESFKSFSARLREVVMDDFYALDRMYWEIPVRPGEIETKIVSKPANPHHFKDRQLGLEWANHIAMPWVNEPGKVYRSSAQISIDKLDARKPRKALTRFEELVEDALDGLEHFDQRKGVNGRVELIDGFWISENGIWRNLKHGSVIDGRSLSIKNRDGKWETVDNPKKYIGEMWDKVQNGPKPLKSPHLQSLNPAPKPSARQNFGGAVRSQASHWR